MREIVRLACKGIFTEIRTPVSIVHYPVVDHLWIEISVLAKSASASFGKILSFMANENGLQIEGVAYC